MRVGRCVVAVLALAGCAQPRVQTSIAKVEAPGAASAAAPESAPAPASESAPAPASESAPASASAAAPESAPASASLSDPPSPAYIAALRDASEFGMIRLVHAMPPPQRKWDGPIPDASLEMFVDDKPRLALLSPDQGSTNLPLAIPYPLVPFPHADMGDFYLRKKRWGPPVRDVTCVRSPAGACEVRVAGSLSPDDIRRVIRRYHQRFAFCYEQGLHRSAALAGRLEVSFVIGEDGTVVSAKAGKAELADQDVLACVVRSFYGITFPRPPSGIVTVSYPMLFDPVAK